MFKWLKRKKHKYGDVTLSVGLCLSNGDFVTMTRQHFDTPVNQANLRQLGRFLQNEAEQRYVHVDDGRVVNRDYIKWIQGPISYNVHRSEYK